MISLKNILLESNLQGVDFISVDIQSEYESSFSFNIYEYTDFLNSHFNQFNKLLFLYNGEELGMTNENDYKAYLLENELNEEVIEGSIFYEKNYGFYRYLMDGQNLDDSVIANFVRFMYNNGVNDSRDMTREMWAKYLRLYRRMDRRDIYDLLKISGDCVHIPNLMRELIRYRNIVMCGGGQNECLKEVEIALQALNKPYKLYNKFIY